MFISRLLFLNAQVRCKHEGNPFKTESCEMTSICQTSKVNEFTLQMMTGMLKKSKNIAEM